MGNALQLLDPSTVYIAMEGLHPRLLLLSEPRNAFSNHASLDFCVDASSHASDRDVLPEQGQKRQSLQSAGEWDAMMSVTPTPSHVDFPCGCRISGFGLCYSMYILMPQMATAALRECSVGCRSLQK